MRRLLFSVMVVALAAVAWRALNGVAPAAAALTIDALLDIKHPSDPEWSPDGSRVAFIWDRAGVQNVWVVNVRDGRAEAPVDLTRGTSGLIRGMFWNHDGSRVLFGREADLWQVAPDGAAQPEPVWKTPAAGGGMALSPDGQRVAFSRGGDIWIRSLADGGETQLTSTPDGESGPQWSPDGARIAYSVSYSMRRSHGPEFWGSKIQFTWTERTKHPDVGIVTIADRKTTLVASTAGAESTPRWIDATRLSLQRVDETYHTREIVVGDATSGAGRVADRDTDPKWFGLTYDGADPIPSPDGRWVAFLSDRDGWDHAYIADTTTDREIQLTHGNFIVSHLAWSPDSRHLAFATNQGGPAGRKQIAVVDVNGGAGTTAIKTLTSGAGANTSPIWSPKQDWLLFQHVDPHNSPDFQIVRTSGTATAAAVRITDSMPPAIDRTKFVEPQFVTYKSWDGKPVPAALFVPPGLDKSRKHPAIVWVHGDIITQNYEGWHVRRDYAVYYSFHQYLLQKGYVVLAPDYRGSTGYSKEWRQGLHRDLGGREYQDVAAGGDYLKTLGFVDGNRMGIWGLSYGGFLTLQAVTMDPTEFACAVDVAGVTDWGDYTRDPGQAWHDARMGTREDNPKQYDQGAPVRRAARVVSPLLILGGTADTNVPFEQTAAMLDQLLKAGKDVEFMMYPGEFHYFQREHVLRDAWRRVERFFDAHLKTPKGT